MSTLHDEFENLDHDDVETAEEQAEREKLEQLRREKEIAEEEARGWWEEALKSAAPDADAEQRKNYDTLMNTAVAKRSVADKAIFAYEAQAKIVADLEKKHEEERKFREEKKKIVENLPDMDTIDEEMKRRDEETSKYPTLEELEEQKRENARRLEEANSKYPTLEELEEQKRENARRLEEANSKYPTLEELEEQKRQNAKQHEDDDDLHRSNAMTDDELVDVQPEEKKAERANAMTEDELSDMLPDEEKKSEEKIASEEKEALEKEALEKEEPKKEDPDKGLSKEDKDDKYREINRAMEPIIQGQFDKIKALYNTEDEKTGKSTGLAQNFKVFEDSKDKHGSAEFKEMYDALAGLNPEKSITDMYVDVLGPKHDYSKLQKLREQISEAYEKTQNYVAMKDSTKTKWSLGKGKTYLKEAQDALQRLGDMRDCLDTISLNREKLQEAADYKYSIPDRTGVSLKELEAEEVVTKERRKEETLKKTKERQKGTNKKKPEDKKKQSPTAKESSKKGK